MAQLRGVRVVVVGGGLSGLTAARALSRHGADVHVVEARERFGGRVWTLREDDFSPEPVELGGEFIDGSHSDLRDLARELGLELTRVIRAGFGLALEVDGRLRIHTGQQPIWQRFRKTLEDAAAAFEESQCNWQSSVAATLGRRSLDDLLRWRGATEDVRALAAALRGFFAADPDALSALVGVELSMETTDPGHVSHYRVKGGNELLVNALTRTRNVRFSLRRAVKRVQQSATEVTVSVVEPDGRVATMRADYLIVTVPPTVLRTWTFAPAMPADQRRAFDALSYGLATKALLRFDRRWWRRAGRPRAFGTNLPIGAVWEASETRTGPAVLTLLAGGRASDELREILESGGGDAVVERLRWLGAPEPLREIRSVTWERDRWARGGYAFFGPSFEPSWRDHLSRAFGRVFFAGDHTSREYQGFMNGAVESGQRVAKEVAALHRLAL
jgi:monoamine oxidase